MQQSQSDVPPEYDQIQKIVEDFKRVISFNLRNNQGLLVQELQVKSRHLKQSIQHYKKQTSTQNIQRLISKKRYEKENQRLQLQIEWRNLTEKYKKLQQEEKRLNQENRQNKFDVENLENKITQLKKNNQELENKIKSLKSQDNNVNFITQVKNVYNSPYKYNKQFMEKNNQFKKEISHTKYTLSNQRVRVKEKHNENHQFKIFNSQNKHLQSLLPSVNNNEQYFHEYNSVKMSKTHKIGRKDEKWSQLMQYLKRPSIREKIFDMIRRQN